MEGNTHRNAINRHSQNQQGRVQAHPIPGASSRTHPSPAAPTRHDGTPPSRPVSANVTLQEICDEVRRGYEEQRKLKEDMRKIGQDIQKIVNEFKELNQMLKSQAESSFSIESSVYKVGL